MKRNYTLISFMLIAALLTAFISHEAFSQQKSKTKVKKVKVNATNASKDDSVKVIVKTIELKDVKEGDVNVDSLIETFKMEFNEDKHGSMQIIRIENGDTLINQSYGDSLDHVWVHNSGSGKHIHKKMLGGSGNEFVFFSDDSGKVLEYDMDVHFDSDGDSLKWVDEDGNKVVIMKHGGSNHDEDVEVIVHKVDKGNANKMIFINDDGENIRIERDGEMVFIHKNDDVKDINSHIEVMHNRKGERMVLLQTRILLDDLSSSEESALKNAGFKLASKAPEFEYIKFHPNPSKSAINIEFKLTDAEDTQVVISDMLGKTIFEEHLKEFSGVYNQKVDVKQFGPGSYILQIKHGKKAITRKVIVE